MALLNHLLIHGTFFAVILTTYLLAVMRAFPPRVWGYSDYPKEVTEIVDPQTDREQRLGGLVFIPFILLGLGFPIVSTLMLEASLGGTISLLDAFVNVFGIMMFGNFADLVILDTLIVGTWTPQWVIIPGTEHLKDTAYKDFRIMHAKGHVWGTIAMALISLVFATLIALI
jgi:hypothetical protein